VPQQLSVDDTHGFSGNISYKLAPWGEVRSLTAWRGVTTNQFDNSGGAHRSIFAPNTNFSRYSLSYLRQTQFSQEFQLVGSIPSLDYVAGLYYFTENAREYAGTPSSNKWNADGTGYTINSENAVGTISSGNQGWDYGSWFVQRDSHAKAHSYAAFAQMTWTPAFLDKFHLTGGFRYTKDTRSGALTTVSGVATPTPSTTAMAASTRWSPPPIRPRVTSTSTPSIPAASARAAPTTVRATSAPSALKRSRRMKSAPRWTCWITRFA
jgi:iron complex outermembrane receptor protein